MSDTWVASDDLGRMLPLHDQTGKVKPEKKVAMFYFLWLGRHGEEGPFDITKILSIDPEAINKPDSPLWGSLGVFHHWGESIFGYYRSEDEWVLRKHAQMLGDAGIDLIVFDVTNQLTYPESYRALCKVFQEARKQGNHTPQIAFLTPFRLPRKVVYELWDNLYSKREYEDLWYKIDGKPFILADPLFLYDIIESDRIHDNHPVRLENTLGLAFETDKPFIQIGAFLPTWSKTDSAACLSLYKDGPEGEKFVSKLFENHPDNQPANLVLENPLPAGKYYLELSEPKGPIGWWVAPPIRDFKTEGFVNGDSSVHRFAIRIAFASEKSLEILDAFTFRKPQPDYFVGPTGPNQWGWLEVFPQHGFYTLEIDENGNEKRVIEEVAIGTAQNAVEGKLGVLSNPNSHGRSFHDGKEPSPEKRDFTGRNFEEQWKRAYELDPKYVFITGWNEWIMMRFDKTAPFHGAGEVSFVDQFDMEFSRDIEPVKGGHGDAYYYQMISHVRKFKGTRKLPKVVSRNIEIDGKFEDWNEVSPEYRDTIGDISHRNERGWGKDTIYLNETGRNDIIIAKTSKNETSLDFYVRTAELFKGKGKSNWMLLFLDIDCDPKTGWLGYDFLVKHEKDGNSVLMKNIDGKYRWEKVLEIPCGIGEKELEISIPPKVFAEQIEEVHFKWTDGIEENGEWSDFTLHGDSAPNDRYNYRAEF